MSLFHGLGSTPPPHAHTHTHSRLEAVCHCSCAVLCCLSGTYVHNVVYMYIAVLYVYILCAYACVQIQDMLVRVYV